jgi:hypothetical protein
MSNIGLFQNDAPIANDFNFSNTFNVSFTGAFNSGVVTFRFQKIGNTIVLRIPSMQAVATAAAVQNASVAIDAIFRPSTNITLYVPGVNNAVAQAVRMNILSTGFITFATLANGTFTNAALCGNENTVVTYTLN